MLTLNCDTTIILAGFTTANVSGQAEVELLLYTQHRLAHGARLSHALCTVEARHGKHGLTATHAYNSPWNTCSTPSENCKPGGLDLLKVAVQRPPASAQWSICIAPFHQAALFELPTCSMARMAASSMSSSVSTSVTPSLVSTTSLSLGHSSCCVT